MESTETGFACSEEIWLAHFECDMQNVPPSTFKVFFFKDFLNVVSDIISQMDSCFQINLPLSLL